MTINAYHQFDKCNTTSSSDETLWAAYNVLFPVILATGMAGNVMNLMVLTRPSLRGVTYVYLTGLAVTDLAVMISAVPAVLRYNSHQSIPYLKAYFHAYLELVLTNTFMVASVFIVCCMTVDRYFSVCRPSEFKNFHTRSHATLAILFSYLLGLAISCPLAALKKPCLADQLNGTDMFSYQENREVTKTTIWKAYLWVCEPAFRILPAVILAILNSLIIKSFRKLAHHQREVRQKAHNFRGRLDTSERQKVVRYRWYLEEQRLTNLLTAIIISFFITMTPATILSLIYTDHLDNHFHFQVFRAVANNLEICNFALNFFIYCLCSKQFRNAFMSLFREGKLEHSQDGLGLDSLKNGTSCSH